MKYSFATAAAGCSSFQRYDESPRDVADGLKTRQRPGGVERRVERQRGRVLAVALAVGVTGVFFLNVRRIRQHERAQFMRAWRAENLPAKALRDEPRQVATVIEVRVCQHDGVDLRRVEARRSRADIASKTRPVR